MGRCLKWYRWGDFRVLRWGFQVRFKATLGLGFGAWLERHHRLDPYRILRVEFLCFLVYVTLATIFVRLPNPGEKW